MPLKGLSWFRLKEHFRKTCWIYIVGAVAMLILTNLLYTTTRPRTPAEQEVLVYLTDSYTDSEPLDDVAEEALVFGQSIDETLMEVRFEPIMYSDPSQDINSAILLMTRMSAGEGDIYLVSSIAMENLAKAEFYQPLDEYLESGWLANLEGEHYVYTSEDGVTSVAGIGIDSLTALGSRSSMNPNGAYLVVAPTSTNMETSMAVIEQIVNNLLEESNASADSEEPAA